MVAAKTAAAVRGSADCCTGLGVPGQPWTAAAAAAAARAPLTACGDWVPPAAEPKVSNYNKFRFDSELLSDDAPVNIGMKDLIQS